MKKYSTRPLRSRTRCRRGRKSRKIPCNSQNPIFHRSMTDLDQNPSTHSPRRKFSFRFPNLSHSGSHEKDGSSANAGGINSAVSHQGANYTGKDRRKFCEEAKNVPDLQVSSRSHDLSPSGPTNSCIFGKVTVKFVVNEAILWA